MSEKKQCCKQIFKAGAWETVVCQRNATLEYRGNWYCRQHHPPTRDKRHEERMAKIEAQQIAESEQAKKARAEARQQAMRDLKLAEYVRRHHPEIVEKLEKGETNAQGS